MDEVIGEVEALLEQLRETKVLVIVEGQKDKKALGALGITNVLTLTKPLFSIVEEVAEGNKQVVILTDLDKEGKKVYAALAKDLQKHQVKVDDRLRKLLFKTPVRHIEGLATYVRNVRSQSL